MSPRTLAIIAGLAIMTLAAGVASAGYVQTNLTSDIPALAANLDPNLKNPRGMSFGL
jgi:hypothetical protein